MTCLLPVLEEMKVIKTQTSSNSLIVFGKIGQKEIVLKLAPEPQLDNSLKTERDVYMFVKNQIGPFTPHFARGIEVGACNLSETLAVFGPQNAKKLHQIRGQLLSEKLWSEGKVGQQQIIALDAQFTQHPPPDTTLEEFISQEIIDRYNQIPYIIIPKLRGISLTELIQNANGQPFPPHFELEIAAQVAQALYIAQLKRFIHNDLHPGNVMIEILHTPRTIFYNLSKFPIPFRLTTKYIVTIFDFDLSYYEGMETNTKLELDFCPTYGLCNEFTLKFDWETFLRLFVNEMENAAQLCHLRTLLGGNYREDVILRNKDGEAYGFRGRPCVCRRVENGACVECERKTLESLAGPQAFLASLLTTDLPFLKAEMPPTPHTITIHTPIQTATAMEITPVRTRRR